MTREEMIKGLRTHLDHSVNCDNCPLKDIPDCFDKLITDIIHILEGTDDVDKEV